MDAVAISAAIAGCLLALAAVRAARQLPAASRTRASMQQAASVVITLNLLPALILFTFQPGENIVAWVAALVVGFGAFGVVMVVLGLLTGLAKGWDVGTRGWLALALLGGLIALALVVINLLAARAWYATLSSVGLTFAAALLLFICIARHGPEAAQTDNQPTGVQS